MTVSTSVDDLSTETVPALQIQAYIRFDLMSTSPSERLLTNESLGIYKRWR